MYPEEVEIGGAEEVQKGLTQLLVLIEDPPATTSEGGPAFLDQNQTYQASENGFSCATRSLTLIPELVRSMAKYPPPLLLKVGP